MKAVTIYHNPRCSKSRETLKLIEQAEKPVVIIEYLKMPLDPNEIGQLCRKLGVEPQSIIRFKEPLARELQLSPEDGRTRAEWLSLIAEHPILMERPIVVCGDRAAVGRPPEAVKPLLA